MEQSFYRAHAAIAEVCLQKGLLEEAIAEFQWVAERYPNPTSLAGLARGLAMAGRRGEALEILDQLTKWDEHSWRQNDVSRNLATIYVALGEEDSALQWLEKAYEESSSNLVYLKVDPQFDTLRAEPRFHDLLRRMNFPQ